MVKAGNLIRPGGYAFRRRLHRRLRAARLAYRRSVADASPEVKRMPSRSARVTPQS
jgi:hypothetical protein